MKKYSLIISKATTAGAALILFACSPAQFENVEQVDSRVLPAAAPISFSEFLKLDGVSQEELVSHYGYRCDGGIMPPVLPGPIEPLPYPIDRETLPGPIVSQPQPYPYGEDGLVLSTSSIDAPISTTPPPYWLDRPKFCIPICRVYRVGSGVVEPQQTGSANSEDNRSYIVSTDDLGKYNRDEFLNDDSLTIGWCRIVEPPRCLSCETPAPELPVELNR